MASGEQFNYRTVKQAVRFLGTGTHVDVPTSRDNPEAFTYKAYQLVDISHLVEMMFDFPRFAVLTKRDHFRNTVTYAGAISFAASKIAKLDATQRVEFKPTLVVADTMVIGCIADTFRTRFDGELSVHLICGKEEDAHEDFFKSEESLLVPNEDNFKEILENLDRSDLQTAKTVFVMSYQHLFRFHYTTTLASIKSLSEVDRERLGLNDLEDAETNSIDETQSKRPTPSPAKRAARILNSVKQEGTYELVRIHEPNNYLDFGIVICEEKDETDGGAWADDAACAEEITRDNLRRAQSISALKRDSLILAVERPILDYKHLLRYLRLGIRNIPKLPALPDDCPLTRFYHDDFDPEIAVTSKEYTARSGQKRKFDSGCQPLIEMQPSTEEGELAAKLYYTKGTRWWIFSSRLLWLTARQLKFDPVSCKAVIDSIVSQLVLQRDKSMTF
ncbi:hypothetical protein F4782DRAFT_504651 [Xylaria castorea]|nr:hypothetical protein F4782DRAFT_504651 [Xylaria castorea]